MKWHTKVQMKIGSALKTSSALAGHRTLSSLASSGGSLQMVAAGEGVRWIVADVVAGERFGEG